MTILKLNLRTIVLAYAALGVAAGPAIANEAGTVTQAVNFFQNGQFTGGAPLTVDVKGPVEISDKIEFPGFAFNVYDVDVTVNSLTMTLIADLEKLKITLYDNTTFDRYFFAFDHQVTSAELSDKTDENFKASLEIVEPGTQMSSKGAFVDGMQTDFTFDLGGILITITEGTDLTKITDNGGSLIVSFN